MFPFKRSAADEIRDLWGHNRRQAQARALGKSSITEGEGAIELISSSGVSVGVFGDLPGGGQGFGLRDGSSVKNITDIFADSDDVAALDGRVGTAEGRLDSHASRLGSAEGRLDSHASRIGAAENVNSTQNSRLNAVEATNSTQNSRLNSIESEITTARGGFTNLGSRLDSHASRLGAAENDITDLEYDFTNVSIQYSILRSQMDQVRKWFQEQTPPGWPPLPD